MKKITKLCVKHIKRYIERITKELEQQGYGDAEGLLDGIMDCIDSQLTYSENKSIIQERLLDMKINPFHVAEAKLIEDRKSKFLKIEQDLLSFKKELFSIRGKIAELRKAERYYSYGYNKLSKLWRELEQEQKKYPIEYVEHTKYEELLGHFRSTDTYFFYNSNFNKKRGKKCNFWHLKPCDKNIIIVKKLSEGELMKSMSYH